MAWSHVGDDAIVLPTGKSRQRREAIIPLYDELRAVLERIPKRATTILTSARRRPPLRGRIVIFISMICVKPRRPSSPWRV